MSGTTERVLTDEMVAEIQSLLPRYPSKQAVTLPALHLVHERLRHVPLAAVVEIAEILGLAPADVQDTLSFYGFFKQDRPHGNVRAWVCRSISCHLLGAEEVLAHLSRRLGVKPGETTADGKITLEYAECLGACEFAPCMLAGTTLHRCLDAQKADQFVDQLK
ncbi:MAG: NAD(P)H-dependent oxidoreductase subunit E [Planctomycetes bacterium]|nr:NAD(P)H-dependent oxidoreductase subunit E [Planctomycetota bacterium]